MLLREREGEREGKVEIRIIEFVTNKSQEGSQFCRGFGGIGGILRYQLDMRSFDDFSDDGGVYDESE